MYHYQAYGFSIRSDIALPAPEAESTDAPSLTIAKVDYIDANGEAIGPFAQSGADWIAYSVPGVVQFHVSRNDGIRYVPAAGGDDASIATFLINSALPCAAMLAGRIGLRGTALAKREETLLLIGLPAKGKSSTAAALVQRGYSVLGDGVCVLDAEGHLLPGLGTITLPDDAVIELGLPADDVVRTRPGVDRSHWPQTTAPGPAPRNARHIYQLIVHTQDRIDFSEVRGAERLNMLRACTFRPAELTRYGLQQNVLAAGAAISATAQLRRAWRPVKDCPPAVFAERIMADIADTKESR